MKSVSVWMAAALMAAAAANVAAQDSVTLYGVIDIGVGGGKQTGRDSSLGMVSGLQYGSRWGLQGREDLGNGTALNFRLESGFDPSNGEQQQGGRLFGRAAWVGMSGAYGEFRAGRQVTPSSDYFTFVDPFGAGFGQAGLSSSFNGTSTNRANNMVSYLSPQMAGLQAIIGYSFNRDGGVAGSDHSDRLLSAIVMYDNGPLKLAATYEAAWLGRNTAWGQRMRALDPQGDLHDPYNVQVGGLWDFGRVRASAAWSYMKNGYTNPDMGEDFGTTGLSPNFGTVRGFPGSHVNAWLVGLAADVAPATTVFGTWQMSDPANHMFVGTKAHNQQVYSLGATYTMSPRTDLYAFYSYADQAWFDADWYSHQYAVGIRHSF